MPKKKEKTVSRSTLPPPAGYSSWLAYAVATLDHRILANDHDRGNQPQWPARVMCEQMRAAAQAELRQIEGHWQEMVKAWAGKLKTAEFLAISQNRRKARRYTITVRERGGRLWITLPLPIRQRFGLRVGDTVRWQKQRGKSEYMITFFRRGRPSTPNSDGAHFCTQ